MMLESPQTIGVLRARERREICSFLGARMRGLAEQRLRLREGLVELGGVFAAAAGAFGLAAAFAADDRGDGLDDLAGLHLGGVIRRDGPNERDSAIGGAA